MPNPSDSPFSAARSLLRARNNIVPISTRSNYGASLLNALIMSMKGDGPQVVGEVKRWDERRRKDALDCRVAALLAMTRRGAGDGGTFLSEPP
jgi:hypothetical protein